MTIDALLLLSGLFVLALPFLGFPHSWDTVLLVLAGSFIVILGIIVRRRGLKPRSESFEQSMIATSASPARHEENTTY